MDPVESEREQDQDQNEFSPSQISAHNERYPFIAEFSEFLANVSTEALETKLMTQQQKQFARAIWEAENYGGSQSKCETRLKEIYGPSWRKIASTKDHMIPLRDYYEYVLILEHQKQWDQSKKMARLP